MIHVTRNTDFLCHHGVKGQKWGERRFQNEDGTLTEAGKKRYYMQERRELRKEAKQISNKSVRRRTNKEIDAYLTQKYGSDTVESVRNSKRVAIGAAATGAFIASLGSKTMRHIYGKGIKYSAIGTGKVLKGSAKYVAAPVLKYSGKGAIALTKGSFKVAVPVTKVSVKALAKGGSAVVKALAKIGGSKK